MCFRIFVCGLILAIPLGLIAQKKEKPRILVYGSDVVALNAAVQAARSNVPTVWVLDEAEIANELTGEPLALKSNAGLDGGLWMEILMEMTGSKERNDSLARVVKNKMNPRLAKNAVEKIIGKLANLTVVKGEAISQLEARRRGWQVTLSNRQKYSVLSIVDASRGGDLVALHADSSVDSAFRAYRTIDELALAESRTTLALGELQGELRVVLLSDLLAAESDNLFDLRYLRTVEETPETIPFRSAVGQALGATAGYCAFFKVSSDRIDIRKLQSELLAFRARLSPYQDVSVADRHFSALQKFYLTGYFMGADADGSYHLGTNKPVRLEEVKDVFNSIYTRSQLWFLDHYHQDEMTWSDLMELIKFVSFKGDEIVRQVRRDWQTKLEFRGEYDPNRIVTREHFAVITDLFSTAFSKAINEDGSFVK